MTLFDAPSHYREKAAMWRIFSLLPLYGGLARGQVFRWFALNIPMDFLTGGAFTSDVDVVAKLRWPREDFVYRAWEVKVSLLHADGMARSLKAGKLGRTLIQLQAYRAFGLPDVSLLDTYVCETGFMDRNKFPPESILDVTRNRMRALVKEGFGYQLLPFEHANHDGEDYGFSTNLPPGGLPHAGLRALPAKQTKPADSFVRWVKRLDDFFEGEQMIAARKCFHQIVFCRACRRLGLILVREQFECPHCRDNLIIQS